MKSETDIIEFFKKLFSYESPSVNVSFRGNFIMVGLEQMYNYIELDFKKMKAIGEFFNTDKINFSNGARHRGCETCDYGSSYTVDIDIELGNNDHEDDMN